MYIAVCDYDFHLAFITFSIDEVWDILCSRELELILYKQMCGILAVQKPCTRNVILFAFNS